MVTLGDANIARILADPPLVWRVIAPDAPELYESARRPPKSFWGRIFGRPPVAEAVHQTKPSPCPTVKG